MLKIPLVAVIAAWMQLVPLLVAIRRPRLLRRPHVGVVLWLVLLCLMDLTAYLWSHVWGRGNNHMVSYVFMPLQSTVILWALSEWQVFSVARLTVRYCIPLLWLWWGLNIAYFEDRSSFSVLGVPVYGMLALAAAVTALVSRALRETRPILRQDWSWILGGIAVFFATNATVTIVQSVAQQAQDWVMVVRVIVLKSGIDILAMLCIAGGFAWLAPRRSSGDSSWLVP